MTTPGEGSTSPPKPGGKWRLPIILISLTFATSAILATLYLVDRKPDPLTAEILVLGDSQLSFGGGPTLSAFFKDLPNPKPETETPEP